MTRSSILIISLLLLVIMGGQTCFAQTSEEPPDAVYNYKTWDCEVKGDGFVLSVKHRLTINHKRGDDYNHISVRENSFSKLIHMQVRVFDAEGNEVYKRKKKDIEKSCGFGSGALYNDVCYFHTSCESSRYPYSIEWEYTLESRSLFFLPGAWFQHHIPVERASYVLRTTADTPINYKIYNGSLEPVVWQDGDRIRYTWMVKDVPALDDIDYVPPGFNEPLSLELAAEQFTLDDYTLTGCTWAHIGAWHNDLAAGMYALPDSQETIPDQSSKLSVLRDVYRDVIANTRYVAVQIGVGGWQPYPASLTARRGYGDCKDMSTLLIARLRAHDIEAYPCLVLTRSEGLMDTTFPNVRFNHVIAAAIVEGDTVWMDPTCSNCPLGDIPRGDEDINVLIVGKQGGQIARTPASTTVDNRQVRSTEVHIDADRKASFTTKCQLTGEYARYLRFYLTSLDNDETRRFINRQFPGTEKKIRINTYDFINLSEIDLPLTIKVSGERIKPVDRIGPTTYSELFVLCKSNGFEHVALDDRQMPLYLLYPELEEDHLTLTWDSSLAVDSVVAPEDDSLSYSFGEIALHSAIGKDTVRVDFSKAYFDYSVDTAQFVEFKQFCAKARKLTSQHVKLISASAK